MKLSNFASLDESLSQAGLVHASKLDKDIWEEFTSNWDNIALESEEILTESTNDIQDNLSNSNLFSQQDTESMHHVKVRLGQQFFRSTVLSNYSTRCCICQLPIESLLIASHIIPWRVDTNNRLNPCNGLSLCAIHDKAFDRGYLTIDEEFNILLSPEIMQIAEHQAVKNYFTYYQYKPINMPEKFIPGQVFLEYHRNNIFIE